MKKIFIIILIVASNCCFGQHTWGGYKPLANINTPLVTNVPLYNQTTNTNQTVTQKIVYNNVVYDLAASADVATLLSIVQGTYPNCTITQGAGFTYDFTIASACTPPANVPVILPPCQNGLTTSGFVQFNASFDFNNPSGITIIIPTSDNILASEDITVITPDGVTHHSTLGAMQSGGGVFFANTFSIVQTGTTSYAVDVILTSNANVFNKVSTTDLQPSSQNGYSINTTNAAYIDIAADNIPNANVVVNNTFYDNGVSVMAYPGPASVMQYAPGTIGTHTLLLETVDNITNTADYYKYSAVVNLSCIP